MPSRWLSNREKQMVKTRKVKIYIKISYNFLIEAANSLVMEGFKIKIRKVNIED